MFGFRSAREQDVRLTDLELKELQASMSKQERRDFNRRQRQAERDRFWELMCEAELYGDDI